MHANVLPHDAGVSCATKHNTFQRGGKLLQMVIQWEGGGVCFGILVPFHTKMDMENKSKAKHAKHTRHGATVEPTSTLCYLKGQHHDPATLKVV